MRRHSNDTYRRIDQNQHFRVNQLPTRSREPPCRGVVLTDAWGHANKSTRPAPTGGTPGTALVHAHHVVMVAPASGWHTHQIRRIQETRKIRMLHACTSVLPSFGNAAFVPPVSHVRQASGPATGVHAKPLPPPDTHDAVTPDPTPPPPPRPHTRSKPPCRGTAPGCNHGRPAWAVCSPFTRNAHSWRAPE